MQTPKNKPQIDRRDFLKTSLAGSAACLSLTFPGMARASKWMMAPDVDLVLTASEQEIELLPGAKTKTWRYTGQILQGPADCLTEMEEGYLGPTLRLRQGQRVRIRLQNQLPEKTIIHWHGLHLSEEMDAHPSCAIGPGNDYIYEFTVNQRAGTYWYHPHPHGRTGFQVYHGLAGLLIVEDAEEQQLGLPSGKFDLAFCLQDRRIDQYNQLLYLNNGGHDRMMGMIGDKLFINGRKDQAQNVSTSTYRVRVLNGANARIFNLAWDDGQDLQIIGNDGGLLERPENRKSVLLGPGERIDLIRDFSDTTMGSTVNLVSQPLVPGRGQAYAVVSFHVTDNESRGFQLPAQLCSIQPLKLQDAANADSPKVFSFRMEQGKGWTIDGLTHEMRKSTPKETVRLGSLEIWELENSSPGMAMPHPVHIHGSQFQIVERIGAQLDAYLDVGWKDTVLVMPGERVRLLKRFDHYKGYFMYHCHNLEHEDMGMMREFHVV